jgi:hypothetical protein
MAELSFLSEEHTLPRHPDRERMVQWHVFRSRTAAEAFVPAIRLGDNQRLVGGYSRDSVGPLWWVGVQVDSLEQWGNRLAINKHAD